MRWHETWIAAVLVLTIIAGVADALRGSELVLAAKAKAAEEKNNPTTEDVTVVVNEDGTNSTVVKAKPLLTGIPQKDYIYDPNLPRELKGHNLTNYPFYNAVPNDIEFECDGLHDGFYASVPHHCQLYHHCLFGTRYDFLCANYTAFDQKTFICHFVSEVDCANSPKYYKRNEALYKQESSPPPPTTTTTKKTTTTTTTTTSAPARKSGGGRRRRPPYRRRRPVYEYYYDDEDYEDEYYEDEEEELPPPRKHAGRRHHQRPQSGRKDDHTTSTTTSTTSPTPLPADAPLTRAPLSIYAPRALPKIKRPVPINEKAKYDYTTKSGTNVAKPTTNPRTVHDEDEEEDEDYYYEDDYEDIPPPPPLPPPKKKETAKNGRRRVHQQERKRPIRYDDDYDEEEQPRVRKGNRKGSAEDDYRPRSRGSVNKGRKGYRDEEEPIPSERPGFISGRGSSRKRYHEERQKKPERWRSQEYEYYDDEEDESSRYEDDRRRPMRPKIEKMRPRSVKKTTTTTTTTTSKTTSEQPSIEEEDEYEEYDDPVPVSEEIKTRYRNPGTTTLEPHRFSTSNYKSTKQALQSTTESITRQKTQPVTYRRPKPDFRRPTTKPPETFISSVGTPAGFKKPEAELKPKKDPILLSRRPFTSPEDTLFRRPLKTEETSNTEIKKQENIDFSSELEDINLKQNKEVKDITVPEPEANIRFSSESTIVMKPLNQESYYSGDSSAQLDIRPESENGNPRRPIKPEFAFPATGTGERRPDEGYRKLPRPGVFTPTAPENVPVIQVYRRPFIPSPADNSRRPVEEVIAVRRPLKQENFSPLSPSLENGFRRPYVTPVSGEGDLSSPEDQNRRPPKQDAVNSDGIRRPEGMPITVAGFRRGIRPIDKDKKKILEELAYSGRKTKENPTTPETVTERGPNYRNPFSNPPPVKEESEYFKPPKTVEFTAPGPSGEGSTQRPPPVYDIDEEYDVTLNDALQPSTLNPTLHYARVKTRGYQSAVTHPSYHSLLIPSASQTFYSKTPAHSNDDFETVVLPATRFTQARFKQRRPAEWYW